LRKEERGASTSRAGQHPAHHQPAVNAASGHCQKVMALTSAASRRAGMPRPVRVLLAEDNELNALLANNVMEMLGCEVVTVANGGEAVAAVQCVRFDVVLMDVHMPGLDGLQAARAIREWESAQARPAACATPPRIPIIALTAGAMPADRRACLHAGMDEVIVKPFRFDELREVLERWAG
jgi:two-component system sensor histidine kinase/response regulator